MSNQKYYYAVVKSENGKLLFEDHKLPFYRRYDIAKDVAKNFKGYTVTKFPCEDIDKIILKSNPDQKV